MIQLPENTYYGKRIPKEKFYSHLEVPATIKQSFVSDIDSIIWLNKLSSTTLNIATGEKVKEIALLEVTLKTKEYNKLLFQFIDKNIPLYVVYLLRFASEEQLLVNYKEPIAGKPNAFKLAVPSVTDWVKENSLELRVEGLNLDSLYEGFVRQIVGLQIDDDAYIDVKVQIEGRCDMEKLERRIAILENKKRNEKQFNKQLEIAEEIRRLKKDREA